MTADHTCRAMFACIASLYALFGERLPHLVVQSGIDTLYLMSLQTEEFSKDRR